MGKVRTELELARRELIDVGFRNSLLHYKVLRSKGIDIVDERPDEVFQILVTGGRPMSFLPAPEEWTETAADADSEDHDLLFDLLQEELASADDDDANGVASRHTDTKLQTRHSTARLERRLLNTFYAARSSIEEQGVNTLYIALGMLRWRDADTSGVERASPLVLIPVELDRTSVRGKFKVRFTGDEVGNNLSLEAKLRGDFRLSIPTIEAAEDLTPSSYFGAVSDVVRRKDGWSVDENAVALGFFSFAKFLMYKDLDPANWPENGKLSEHEVLGALLGDGFDNAPWELDDSTSIDEVLAPAEMFHIRDADSSQTTAILRAHAGHNLVIQGPPGTGKSQTISNLIAEGIVQGKKILFVSEKMAALEVVKRRLDEDGIGVACLEIHSNKTNKKEFLDELEQTLSLGRPKDGGRDRSAAELLRSRDRLNEYCRAVNEPLTEDIQTAPIRVFGHLGRLQRSLDGADIPALDDVNVEDWSWESVRGSVDLLRDLEGAVEDLGAPLEHPFWGSDATVVLPRDHASIRERALAAKSALDTLRSHCADVSSVVDLPEPTDAAELAQLERALELLCSKPRLGGLDPASALWATRAQELQGLVTKGRKFRKLHAQHDEALVPDAWRADINEARRTLMDLGDRWWRFAAPSFWRARKFVRGLFQNEVPGSVSAKIEILDAISSARQLADALNAEADLLEQVLRNSWKKDRTQWQFVAPSSEWCLSVHNELSRGRVPENFLGALEKEQLPDKPTLQRELTRLRSLRNAFNDAARSAFEAARFHAGSEDGEAAPEGSWDEVAGRFDDWAEDPEAIQEVARFNHLAVEVAERGLEQLLDIATTWESADSLLGELLEYTWFNAFAEKAFHDRPVLARFQGESHEAIVEKFGELDVELLQANRSAVAHAHFEGLPPRTGSGQVGVLLHEFNKKRRHKPIRRLMEEAGMAIQAIKPVFMMSPLSVATYIPPGTVDFDLVIFDEASQVRPVEAFGAIARSKQAVVVGDSKQLPPTSFFDKIIEAEDDDEAAEVADLESILSVFSANGAPSEMLRWHYRSKHESLIAVSNHEFYEGKLVTFPSPLPSSEALGVTLRHLPHTTYARGSRKAHNRGEAAAVAKAVMQHARTTPNLTLGVAAFSKAQSQELLDHVELERRKDPSLESFFTAHPEEPFFVKNLENVQGDERDVIFISIGYGKDAEGYLAHNFGPLNRDGGERRLNVLITRARRRCEVFTNFLAGDIDLARSRARGVVALKRYLHFAEHGQLDLPVPTGGDAESPFEAQVAHAIHSLGHEYDHQVGSGGFRIDLAIRDPESPGRYLLGIECDGASYHSARWARDRDRIRQGVLEGLGWKIHRIWSTDWFRNPERELRRLEERIQKAMTRLRDDSLPTSPSPMPTDQDRSVEREDLDPEDVRETSSIAAEPYECADLSGIAYDLGSHDLHELPAWKMAKWICRAVDTESPVHQTEVARRITEAAGLKRTGKRIVASVTNATKHAERKGSLELRGEFLWSTNGDDPVPRDRSALSQQSRKIEMVAPEEIEAALLMVVGASIGIARDDAVREAASVLGYARVTEAIFSGIDAVVSLALESGSLRAESDFLVVSA